MHLIWIYKDPNPKGYYEKININAVLKCSVIIWYSVHPYTIFFLKNIASYKRYWKAITELWDGTE